MGFEMPANLASAKIFSESAKQKLRLCNPFEGKPMQHLQPANFTVEIDLRGETLIYCEGWTTAGNYSIQRVGIGNHARW